MCNVIKGENIVEIGYIREYPLVRVDEPNGDICLLFYSGAFTIKNLPTPYHVPKDPPPINVIFINGTQQAAGDVLFAGDFYAEIQPAPINHFSIYLHD